jgi:hypothetical protein
MTMNAMHPEKQRNAITCKEGDYKALLSKLPKHRLFFTSPPSSQ